MTDTSRSDQCEPPSATETLRASLMGRKMCVVLEKSGRASLRVRGSGVCISMKAIEGRRRTMFEEGNWERDSRSRYLRWLVWRRGEGRGEVLFPECYGLCELAGGKGRTSCY